MSISAPGLILCDISFYQHFKNVLKVLRRLCCRAGVCILKLLHTHMHTVV